MTSDMTPAERGRLGGLATAERYRARHMRKIGRLGLRAQVRAKGAPGRPRARSFEEIVADPQGRAWFERLTREYLGEGGSGR
jgi:hypothetical protein